MAYEPYKRRASASQLNLLLSCKRKWFYKYVERVKEPTTVAMLRGTWIHSTLEHFFTDMDIKKSGITKLNYKEKFNEYAFKVFDEQLVIGREYFGKPLPSIEEDIKLLCVDAISYAMEIAEARVMVRNFVNKFLIEFEQYVLKYDGQVGRCWYSIRPKQNELVFDFDDVIGYADEVYDYNGEPVIRDIKTSKLYKSGFSSENLLQLKLYSVLYYRKFGVLPKYGIIYYIRYSRECCYEFDESIIQEMEDLLLWYKDVTESVDIADYPRNLDYVFCTANCATKEKNRDKDWCYFADRCSEECVKDE